MELKQPAQDGAEVTSVAPNPTRVVVVGACSEVGKMLAMMIARGDLFGHETLLDMTLVETKINMGILSKGFFAELGICNLRLLYRTSYTSDMNEAFKDAQYIFLASGVPVNPAFTRNDMLSSNSLEYKNIGIALGVVGKNCKILVVEIPHNVNLAVLCHFAPHLDPKQITALSLVDHNRCMAKLAKMLNISTHKVTCVGVWGNSLVKVFLDMRHAWVDVLGKTMGVYEAVGNDYYLKFNFPCDIAARGDEIYKRRKMSSALTVVNAAIQHMKLWIEGTPDNNWTSMVVISDGSYDIEKGLPYSFPVRVDSNGTWEIVKDLDMDFFEMEKLHEAEDHIRREKNFVFTLLDITSTQNDDDSIPMEWSFGQGLPIPCRILGVLENQRMAYF